MRNAKLMAAMAGLLICVMTGLGRAAAVVQPPHSTVEGKTLEEWSAAWWQHVTSIDKSVNPLFDTTGAEAHRNQSGNIFFLVGKFGTEFVPPGPPVTATRNVTIRDDQYLFFPVLNGIAADQDVTTSRQGLADDVAKFEDLHASVDGDAIPNLIDHREISPVFTINLPADNIFETGSAATFNDAVADGVYLMLDPLPAGQHVVNFGGRIGTAAEPSFALDVTYNLTVQSAGTVIPLPPGILLGAAGLGMAGITLQARSLAGRLRRRG